MLSLKFLRGYTVCANHDKIGEISDVCFDIEEMAIKYFEITLGKKELSVKKVNISTDVIRDQDWQNGELSIVLTQKQLEKLIQVEAKHDSSSLSHKSVVLLKWPISESVDKSNLCCLGEVLNAPIQAKDGELGYVEDLLVDEQDWRIRHVVLDTRNWLSNKRVTLPAKRSSSRAW